MLNSFRYGTVSCGASMLYPHAPLGKYLRHTPQACNMQHALHLSRPINTLNKLSTGCNSILVKTLNSGHVVSSDHQKRHTHTHAHTHTVRPFKSVAVEQCPQPSKAKTFRKLRRNTTRFTVTPMRELHQSSRRLLTFRKPPPVRRACK